MSDSPALVRVRVLQTKLTKPGLPDGMVERPRLLARFDPHARVVLVVAPPGFGKTTLVAQWAEASPEPLAWISVDLLDESPENFWRHVIEAVRSVVPDVDDEPGRALAENPASQLFLNILIGQLERFEGRAVVVLDSWSDPAVRSVAEGLALLAERVGDRVQFVLTTRVDPPLPLVRWRTQGWLAEIRERDLRFSDDEALGVASTFRNLGLADEVYLRVNRRADGWPIAFHLALVSAQQAADPEDGLRSLASSDRDLSDFVVAEILDHLPVDEREVVLDLSVVEWFDPDAAVELAGPQAGAALVELRRRRLLITDVPGRSRGMRFHPLFRELLEAELRWRDPTRHRAVHRRAAALWRRRGDVPAAYRHLVAGGELTTAHDLVVGEVLERVDRGDHEGLRLLQLDHPDVAAVDDADLAIDMAIASFFAQAGAAATKWAERADDLIARAGPSDGRAMATRLRLHSLWAILDLMEGRTSDADGHIAAFTALQPRTVVTGPIEQRFATVAARAALQGGRLDDAGRWLQAARRTPAPETIERVTLPALNAWHALLAGRVGDAIDVAEGACTWAAAHGMRPHHGAFDAFVTSAMAHFACGDLGAALERADAARTDADGLGWAWNIVRAASVGAHVRLVAEGAPAALAVVSAAQHEVAADVEMLDDLRLVEATAWHRCGEDTTAMSIVESLADRAAVRVLHASIAFERGQVECVDELLKGSATWPFGLRVSADALTALASGRFSTLRAVVAAASDARWASPFLEHGPRFEEGLRGLPLDELHPVVARLLAPDGRAPDDTSGPLVEHLTSRELTILELLPTHLSYAQIAERLYLSVNTVKSNLKAVYRKLGVGTRSDAVLAGRAAGLI